MNKEQTEHYIRKLRARGAEIAHEIVAAPSEISRKEPRPLTSEEKRKLLFRYVPDETEAVRTLRQSGHKWMWRYMKRRDWKRFDTCLEQLRTRQLPFDEITYNLAMFGSLLHPRVDDDSVRSLFTTMVEERRFHPALLRLQGGFIDSYFELKEVDATPNPLNLLKVARTFWAISVNFKGQRIKETRRKLADAALEQRRLRALEAGGELEGEEVGSDVEDEYDPGEEMDDGVGRPRVMFPAKRPHQLKGVFKGSGVPNRRKHAWKH